MEITIIDRLFNRYSVMRMKHNKFYFSYFKILLVHAIKLHFLMSLHFLKLHFPNAQHFQMSFYIYFWNYTRPSEDTLELNTSSASLTFKLSVSLHISDCFLLFNFYQKWIYHV